ncbi:maleylpyruvate isomerase N-terminal domain-containing protein [Ornithinimicrobium sp. INDO-MA30-4]|uniref:maleylpyruvate isomerase N-terminal domain-containing protein n=1 Tax=Ornithinimicrobium sp. INDO-MA30-4 TaxID=2908651 RepID=UPI001F4155FF|nr:maleylpyruvate isomerase N-terminal domain-containing protein [Ornithinimicrobium sp. INDO-MA30-4]UJH69746.1 maleylpyruvate isomerase N-terminal domain-containing protein [Ornithinimicrobium sp. INDO-MA30-4]
MAPIQLVAATWEPNIPVPSELGARHQQFAESFAVIVDGVEDWDAQTPVAEWNARGVVAHLVGWLPGVLAAYADVVLKDAPDVRVDPAAAWDARAADVQRILMTQRRPSAP